MEDTVVAGGLEFVMEYVVNSPREHGDSGPGMLVFGTVGGEKVQFLRFDMYDNGPHFHYGSPSTGLRYNLDPLTMDDRIGWVMELLRSKLSQMITKAGFEEGLPDIDFSAISAQLPEIERRWRAQHPPA